MKHSLLLSEKGASAWIYIGGAGLLIIILGIVIFALPTNTDTDSDQRPSTPLGGQSSDVPPDDTVFEFDQRHLSGFGDVPPHDVPPVGNFEFVDQNFVPLSEIQDGSTPHFIVATDGNPPVQSYFPVTVRGYNAIDGELLWESTLDGPPDLVCRGPDGCSLDGPLVDSRLYGDPLPPMLFQATSGPTLLAEAGWTPFADNRPGFAIDHELDMLNEDQRLILE